MKKIIYQLADIAILPFTYFFARFFKAARKRNFKDLQLTKKAMLSVGMFPIVDHYYEPLFDKKYLRYPLSQPRNLPGIDFNIDEQIDLIGMFKYTEELLSIPMESTGKELEYCYNEGMFRSGDAEYLYNMIRHFKPKKLVEIGSGHSTLLAIKAIEQNKKENITYGCEHICIEPFENKWLEKTGVKIKREQVENIKSDFFESLGKNDILFIDSSHMIRPQGDVLYEYQEILPVLKSGVVIHIHDIFSPRDYLEEWMDEHRFWNEQYLLEAFLCFNKDFRVIGSTNYLMHNYFDEFTKACPVLKIQVERGIKREPGSFWMVRN
jgi:predicted O-methyltransferase YrrM